LHQYFCTKKIQRQNVTREKLRKALSYEFFLRMLMKLTSGNMIFVYVPRHTSDLDTQWGGGGGRGGGGGARKGQKSVIFYLNGPLTQTHTSMLANHSPNFIMIQ